MVIGVEVANDPVGNVERAVEAQRKKVVRSYGGGYLSVAEER